MTTYRVCLQASPPLTIEADDCDIDTDRAAFYLDDELVAYIPGGSVEYIERVSQKRR